MGNTKNAKNRKKPSLFRFLFLRFQISRYLDPYLRNRNKSLSKFSFLETKPPSKVERLITELNRYAEFYRIQLDGLEQCNQNVETHNREIEQLRSYEYDTDFSAFYKNPESFAPADLEKDYSIGKKIKEYREVPQDIQKRADEIVDAVNNYQAILQQFELHQKYQKIIDLADAYYDFDSVQRLKTQLKDIESAVDTTVAPYEYPFLEEERFSDWISKHNADYVKSHLSDHIFDDINGQSLDMDQRTAILKDERSALTIAGAGSGKTLTICGKAKYLLSLGAAPHDVLFLSYSKKSAEDLERKVKTIHPDFEVGTFHKVGLEILKKRYEKCFMVEDQFDAILERYFREEIRKKPKAIKNVLQYYGLFMARDLGGKVESKGDLYQSLKSADFRTLKTILSQSRSPGGIRRTFKKELVKSNEELAIANFYFLNGVDYVYERPYEHNVSDNEHRQYTPDFYLPQAKIYHEHYGVDQDGRAKQFSGEEERRYLEGRKWKEQIHAEYHTVCLETTSADFCDGTVFQKLTMQLMEHNIPLKPLSEEEIDEVLNSIYDGKNFKSLVNTIRSFVNLYKAKYLDNAAFSLLRKSEFKNAYERARSALFLDICEDFYLYYRDYLKKEDKIDFDDMILQSQSALPELQDFRYSHIVIDEFQDISYSRMKFLQALIKHGDSKLFAVGDDWQSIYRFSGCDVDIFLHFSSYFGRCVTNIIPTTHRYSQELQDIAGSFIMKNPMQLKKEVHSDKHLQDPVQIIFHHSDEKQAFYDALSRISELDSHAHVLVLGRNNYDVENICDDDLTLKWISKTNEHILLSKEYPDLKIRFSTVHGSKGLEEDFVILINANDDKTGFPNQMEDDPVMNLVLSESDPIPFAEERRLWYVAMTRTRSYFFVLADSNHPSPFALEVRTKCKSNDCVSEQDAPSDGPRCPRCHSGRLAKKTAKDGHEFYGCENYPYCDYVIHDVEAVKNNLRCPVCGDYLILRKGSFGEFYGCHNYPYCTFKRNIRSTRKNDSKRRYFD